MRSENVCDLVLDACDLLERAASPAPDEVLVTEAELLRAELCAALATCEDAAVAADGHAAIADLTALLSRREQVAGPVLALSA